MLVIVCEINVFYPGQGGQQVVTQIIRGQAVSTAITGASPVTSVSGQGSPATAGQTAGQTPAGTPRAQQGQGQVKLTLAQLTQLTQVSEGNTETSSMSSVTLCDSFSRPNDLSPLPQKQQSGSGVDRQAGVGGTQQSLTVMVQGQGQTTGQLQVIPHGVTVIPGPGQQLMQAALPNGQVQRFLFTPLPSTTTPASSTGMTEIKYG